MVIMGCIGCALTTVTTLLHPAHLNRYATSVSHFFRFTVADVGFPKVEH